MGHERWFRGQHDGQERPFDWLALARHHGIPWQRAQVLYEEAVRQGRAQHASPDQVQEIYLALLADLPRHETRPSPGKVTRVMRLQAHQSGAHTRSRGADQPIAPGKRTLVQYLDSTADTPEELAPAGHGLDHATLIHGPAAAASALHPADRHRHRLGLLLDGAGIHVPERELSTLLRRTWHDGLSARSMPWLPPEDMQTTLDAFLAGARRAQQDAGRIELLDAATRARVEATTGRSLGPVQVITGDPELARRGVLGEARGNVIRLSPETPGPETELGMKVRLHEAAHILQFQNPRHDALDPHHRSPVAEWEAGRVADAAMHGERREVAAAADPAEAHGFDPVSMLGDAAEAVGVDPLSLLRRYAPAAANLVQSGFDGLLEQAGTTVGNAIQGLVEGLGIDEIAQKFQGGLAGLGEGSLTFGVLTGCCECLEGALDNVRGSLDGFLNSEGARDLQGMIAASQQQQSEAQLDNLANFFELMKSIGGPVMGIIESAASALDSARSTLGAIGDRVWRFVAERLGLDPNLPPLEAIKKKLGELWARVSAQLQPLKDALAGVWSYIKNDSILAPLFRLIRDVPRLVAAIRALIDAKAQGARAWLAILREHLVGTVFQPLLDALESGRDAAQGAAAAVGRFFTGILEKLGLLGAWQSSVAFLQGIANAIRGVVGTMQAAVSAVAQGVQDAFTKLGDALGKLFAAVRPLLDFVVGLNIAIAATLGGNVLALPAFVLGNLWLHVLPDCYKEAIIDFLLDVFISVVAWVPAAGDSVSVIGILRAGALSFLQTLKSAPMPEKIRAMDLIASLFAGNIEFAAGLVVGILKGIYESTIGTVVFVFEGAAWLASLGMELVQVAFAPLGELIRQGLLGDEQPEGETAGAAGAQEPAAEDAEEERAQQDTGAAAETQEGEAGAQDVDDQEDEEEEEEGETEAGLDEDGADTPLDDAEPALSEGGEGAEEEDDAEAGGENESEEQSGSGGARPETRDGERAADEQSEEDEREDEDEERAAEEQRQRSTAAEGRDDGQRLDPLPPLPDDLLNGRALFEHVFKRGVTKEELRELFQTLGTSMEAAAGSAGERAAVMLLQKLNERGAAYEIGEAVGTIVGMVAAEVVIIVLTGGAGAAKTAVTATKMTLKLARTLPRLASLLREFKAVVMPLLRGLQRLRQGIGQWAAKLAKYIDDLLEWLSKAIQKLRQRMRRPRPAGPRPGPRPPRPPRPRQPRRPRRPRRRSSQKYRLAAIQAARAGWRNAQQRFGGSVHAEGVVRVQVRSFRVRVMRPRGARVQLSTARRGSGWQVKAVVQQGGRRRASWKAGRGWIAKDTQHRRHYATISNARLHADIIADSIRALMRQDRRDSAGTVRQQYDAKRRQADELRRDGQRRIDNRLRGIRYTIEMEPLQRVEDDLKITTELLITPNVKRQTAKIPVALSEYLGARRVGTGGSFEGRFDHQDWNWNGYPSRSVTRHPVNEWLDFRQEGTSPRPPDSNAYRSGGGTEGLPGGFSGRLADWRTRHERRRTRIKEALLDANPNMSRQDADRQAMNQICDEYQQQGWPRLPFDQLLVRGHTLWQAHHIQEASWGGSDDANNLQYLSIGDHSQYTTWWDARQRDIEYHLGINQ